MSLSVAENVRLAVQARHPQRHAAWIDAAALADVNRDSAEVMRTMGLAGVESASAASLSYWRATAARTLHSPWEHPSTRAAA
jgi:hypothetical protein